jgi:hypothetical protein
VFYPIYSENEDGWWWDHYKPTPVMPATVIAFIVSDFASVTAPLDTYHPDKPVSVRKAPINSNFYAIHFFVDYRS